LAGSYNGERFYDHQSKLDAYTLFEASFGCRRKVLGINADLSFRINNLTNKEYQVVAWYAMPPRNYSISLSINF
jgi:vitamin B12 transporter